MVLSKLTYIQRRLSTQPVTSVLCTHCHKQVKMTYIDLLWSQVSKRFWYDLELARIWYSEELRLRGLLREYDAKGLEKPGHR